MNRHVYVMPEVGRVELAEQPLPEPEAGQVQIEMGWSLISPGTEVALIGGKLQPWAPLPFPLGYSASGRVRKVGPDVECLAPGDEVAAVTPHANCANVAIGNVYPLPAGVSPERGATINLGIIVMQAVRKARIEPGESVVIVGMGLIGQLAMQVCRVAGGHPVIAVERDAGRCELARRAGADHVLEADGDWHSRLLDLLPDRNRNGADVVIEATGDPEPINAAFAATARMGRVVLLGSTRGQGRVDWYRDVHKKGLTILGAHQKTVPAHECQPGLWPERAEGETWLRLIGAGRLDPVPVLTDRIAARDAPGTYRRLLDGDLKSIGILLDWRGFNRGVTTGSGDGI